MIRRMILSAALLVLPGLAIAQTPSNAGATTPRIFNTVKLKLQEGKMVVGGTVSSSDPDIYCAMAGAGFDFLGLKCNTALCLIKKSPA